MLAAGDRPIYASGECEIDLARRELRVLIAGADCRARRDNCSAQSAANFTKDE
jgi:hypothetical protein